MKCINLIDLEKLIGSVLFKKLKVKKSSNYSTFSGFITNKLNRLPKRGEIIKLSKNVKLSIKTIKNKQIKKLEINFK